MAWIVALLSAGTAQVFGQWNGKWIAAALRRLGHRYLRRMSGNVFERTFDLSAKPSTAIARIAVDSKYWLWVNGRMVVFEGGLKRGPNPRDTYYDQVDLAKYLIAGRNTVAALTWFWGKDGFSHKNSGSPGFHLRYERKRRGDRF